MFIDFVAFSNVQLFCLQSFPKGKKPQCTHEVAFRQNVHKHSVQFIQSSNDGFKQVDQSTSRQSNEWLWLMTFQPSLIKGRPGFSLTVNLQNNIVSGRLTPGFIEIHFTHRKIYHYLCTQSDSVLLYFFLPECISVLINSESISIFF